MPGNMDPGVLFGSKATIPILTHLTHIVAHTYI